ncbi:16S rRNA (guanine(966)-N(2))-methyltransferase RsmD [Pseudonocardiaceae bacterium YIM PH 21723]|nr:16S rRNA (guanine(966)-N(2))-methyltransferase RsmD [Pseudonocardiaceae bacterium YIM PH 21723]
MTRIVAGTAGGRRLQVPPKGTRPTSDRVREALFSALDTMFDWQDARVLDLYAGSGALGLEALSRGAELATFVESHRPAAEILRRNAAGIGFEIDLRIAQVDTVLAQGTERDYDLIMSDPPYDVPNDAVTKNLAALTDNGWAGTDTLVVVERAVRAREFDWPAGWEPLRSRKYGDTMLHWGTHR